MKPQVAIETKPPSATETSAESPLFVEAEKLIQRIEDQTRSIAKRAYEFFEERGRRIGSELEDWFRAEAEVLRSVPVTMKENENQFAVQAEVPGFKANDIKIGAEPRRLVIEGNSEEVSEDKTEGETEKIIFSERRINRFCRAIDLPAEIDPAKVTANLKEGLLHITLPKVPAQQSVNVEVSAV